jgi:hypothetical protein
LSLSSQKYGFGIRDPGSEIRDPEKTYSGSQIPDPGVKKAPDPGSRIPDPGSQIRIRNTAFKVQVVVIKHKIEQNNMFSTDKKTVFIMKLLGMTSSVAHICTRMMSPKKETSLSPML